MSRIPDELAWHVLARFGVTPTGVRALGNHGGFSGARLWRVATANGDWCLKAWPAEGMDSARLWEIHALMHQARGTGLPFVPVPLAAPDGSTTVEAAGRNWELTTWMPGAADYHARPSRARLRAACLALARLHGVWRPAQPVIRPFPGMRRRVAAARSWCALVESGWRPDFRRQPADVLTDCCQRAWHLLGSRISAMPEQLGWLAELPVEVDPCLCDVWHDHVLYSGDTVSGLIDFGGVKYDHVTVDLARLLGSLAGNDRSAVGEGVEAYNEVRRIGFHDAAHVLTLDRTGVLLGIANWLRWLYHERRRYEDRAAVAHRLRELVARVEKWN